ncbi:ATP-binding protein [Brevundimonas sp. SORGH_AS_0993]|uniref:ATP-binding protein n=1 Tax=Brevundimonas sp. SORGH_AS_0993 TaxID=3041794 RepID=UPI002784B44D|nr:ATP-binding protein [Brevundimonas sp. SORGH_AS_0993]MDQ1153834.1 signal transduction histidine kinase/ActR/RegA family two-component response regulator [Brevundimonas sp. SORGH_AS_0993]
MRFWDEIAPMLAISANERIKQTPVRMLLAGLIGWVLYSSGMDGLLLAWIAWALLVQAVELLAMGPFRRADGAPGRRRAIAALISTALMGATYAGAALVIWSTNHPALVTLSALIVAGGLLTNVASGIESRALFFIGGGPYLAALALMPLIKTVQGDASGLVVMSLSSLLFVGTMLNVYFRVHKMRQAEILARAEAERRLEQAQTAMADRAAMAAIVSHELRTPVSAILAGAHLIRAESEPRKREETADLIVDAGRLMTGMLNDLLDHSKMEAGAMALEARDFELDELMRDTARFWTAPATEKGLTLDLVGGDRPVWLKGDPYRLRQIVNNLISNAIKFTPEGTIRIVAGADPHGELRRLTLTVIDQGPGIAPEAMRRLFTPFAQGSAEVARTYGGTGLGLTVSRELARLMGGDLTVDSKPGRGAAFTLCVDLPEGQPTEAEDQAAINAPILTRRIRVLAVDDHEINRRTIALVLQPLDVDLTTASDGHVALLLLEDRPFDVVLMDVNMPGIDGNETTRRLRASGGLNADAPVIGFSAGTEAEQVAACYAAGMTDWLAKPLEPKKLYEALNRATYAGARVDAA